METFLFENDVIVFVLNYKQPSKTIRKILGFYVGAKYHIRGA